MGLDYSQLHTFYTQALSKFPVEFEFPVDFQVDFVVCFVEFPRKKKRCCVSSQQGNAW